MLSRRHVFVVLYAASGAAALVYEVTWTRLLTLLMGHTVAAASTVLGAVMGGLAAGSWIGARFERRMSAASSRVAASRLRWYATLEIVVALAAIALPFLVAALTPALAWAYDDGATPLRFALVRLAISFGVLAIPTMAMGATFPIAAAWFASEHADVHEQHTGRRAGGKGRKIRMPRLNFGGAADAGTLYAANTAGAAAGAIAAGLWLIPAIGVRGTIWIGIGLNVAAAAGAMAIARIDQRPSRGSATAKADARSDTRSDARSDARSGVTSDTSQLLGCAAAAVCGLVGLALEVVWTRLLALVIGPTTYAFTIVVASFIVGIAVGASIGTRITRRATQPALWLGAMLMVMSIGASVAGWFAASRLPLIVASQVARPDAAFGWIVTQQAFGIVVLLLPTTCALGAAFPLALAVASVKRSTLGADVARVYVSNTLGAIGGALLGGFVLLPQLGLHNAFRAVTLTALVAALGIFALAPASSGSVLRRAIAVGAAGLAAAIVVLLPGWNLGLLASGAYKYAPYIHEGDLETEIQTWKLLSYEDGAAATVSVRELAGMRSLVIDGKVDASNAGDMLTQRLLGLLPVLLHPNPQSVCVIGLGSGVTADSTLGPGTVKQADLVEISPEVIKASSFFERENQGVLRKPGVRMILGDGRSHLRLTKQRYDVIVSEPSNPWMAGIASLFTREFFEEARSCLKPNGLICQWAHTYDMSPEDLQSIVRTFSSVFPESTMWLVGEGDLLLIGTNGDAIDLKGIEQRWQMGTVPALLRDVAVDDRAAPFALMSMFAGGPAEMKRYAGDAPIQRDDRTALEFSAPRAIYGPTSRGNAAAIRALADSNATARAVRNQATDASWTVAGGMELRANAHVIAYDRFRRAIELNSRNAEALAGLTDAAAGANLEQDARALLESVARAEPGNAAVRIELSRLLAATGDMQSAASVATEAVRLAPEDPKALEQLASIFADAGDADRLAPVADALSSKFPQRDKSLYYQATLLLLKGRSREAIDRARALVARVPQDGASQNLLGVACATEEQRDCALTAFSAALAANPRDPATYVNLGVFHLQTDPRAAASYFAVAMTLDRSSAAARQGLADAQAAIATVR